MKLLKTLSVLVLVLLIFASCSKDENDDSKTSIEVSGIEFIPNVFLENGKVVGIDADIAAQAMRNSGIDLKLIMSNSWQEAYNATLNGPNKAMLTVSYTPERAGFFKWAGPTSQGMYGIFEKNSNSNLAFPLPIEECKKLSSIAVVTGWLETTTLESLGFTNLVYYESYNEALRAFMNDEIKFSEFFNSVY